MRRLSFLLLYGTLVSAQPVYFGRSFPLTNTRYMEAKHAAKRQIAPMAISSMDTTLVVWVEIGSTDAAWRMGFRDSDGSWRERELSVSEVRRIATDGRDFLVVTNHEAIRFDRNGSLLQPVTALPFSPSAVAWNGSHYIIAGTTDTPSFSKNIVAARLTASGVLSEVSVVRAGQSSVLLAAPRVASDGRGSALVIWADKGVPMQPIGCCRPSIQGALLLDTFPAVAAKSFLIEPTLENDLTRIFMDVAWNGAQYVVAHANQFETKGVYARRVSADGVPEPNRITLSTAEPYELSMTGAGDGAGVGWASYDSTAFRDHVTLIGRSGEVSAPAEFPRQPLWVATSYVAAALPDGRLAYVGFDTRSEGPYYGSHRILMAIANRDSAPAIADAPTISVERNGVDLRVRWTMPAQSVNGYRLEYKVGSGDWTELEQWFMPDERTASFPLPSPAAPAWFFRVRAWSDGGTSAYSNEAVIAPKRRSVR
jgi:hypothetical protein